MDQTKPEDKIFSRYQQKRCADSSLGCNVLLPASDIYQVPKKYGFSLLQLSRVIREMLFERKSLIDILSLKPEQIKIRGEEVSQGFLF